MLVLSVGILMRKLREKCRCRAPYTRH